MHEISKIILTLRIIIKNRYTIRIEKIVLIGSWPTQTWLTNHEKRATQNKMAKNDELQINNKLNTNKMPKINWANNNNWQNSKNVEMAKPTNKMSEINLENKDKLVKRNEREMS
jgi:hypothetical protein